MCGFASLFLALCAMLTSKGQAKHRKFGKLFFYSMTGIFVTAIPLSLIKNNLFLFLIALFSYYLAFTGWRYAKNKEGKPAKFYFIINGVMLTVSLLMIGMGIYQFNIDNSTTITITLLVFGFIGCIISCLDLKHVSTKVPRVSSA